MSTPGETRGLNPDQNRILVSGYYKGLVDNLGIKRFYFLRDRVFRLKMDLQALYDDLTDLSNPDSDIERTDDAGNPININDFINRYNGCLQELAGIFGEIGASMEYRPIAIFDENAKAEFSLLEPILVSLAKDFHDRNESIENAKKKSEIRNALSEKQNSMRDCKSIKSLTDVACTIDVEKELASIHGRNLVIEVIQEMFNQELGRCIEAEPQSQEEQAENHFVRIATEEFPKAVEEFVEAVNTLNSERQKALASIKKLIAGKEDEFQRIPLTNLWWEGKTLDERILFKLLCTFLIARGICNEHIGTRWEDIGNLEVINEFRKLLEDSKTKISTESVKVFFPFNNPIREQNCELPNARIYKQVVDAMIQFLQTVQKVSNHNDLLSLIYSQDPPFFSGNTELYPSRTDMDFTRNPLYMSPPKIKFNATEYSILHGCDLTVQDLQQKIQNNSDIEKKKSKAMNDLNQRLGQPEAWRM